MLWDLSRLQINSFRMALKAYKRIYSFQGPTQEGRGKEIVCMCTLENSSGASEAYPGWNLLVCSTLILRIQKTRLDHHFSSCLQRILFSCTGGRQSFCKVAVWLALPRKADTSWSMSQINDSQSRNEESSQ